MLTCIPPVNCTGWPDDCGPTQPDSDIAGMGVGTHIICCFRSLPLLRNQQKHADRLKVVLSFVLTALITTIASVAVFLLWPSYYEDNFPPPDPIQGRQVLSHGGEVDLAWSEESPCIASGFLDARNLTRRKERRERWVKILDKLILNLSDQQLATSLAILMIVFIR